MTVLTPTTEAEIEAIVRDAAAAKTPLAIEGGGTRTGLGRPVQAEHTLSLKGLSGITLYEPSELVLSAHAGTPLAEIEAALAVNRQRLAFEPADHRAFYGSSGAPTIGGVAAANISGPRRVHSGAARDSMIGIRLITGRGETVKSGGRVMKNVTGYDLVKFAAGSHGTLGVFSEITFKLLPETETEATLVLSGLSAPDAVAALTAALGTPFEVTGAAHLPAENGAGAQTVLRLEGFAASIAYRSERLAAVLKRFGSADVLDANASRALWRRVRDLDALGARADDAVWKISVAPTDGPAIGARLEAALGARVLYDWGGGLVIASVPDTGDAGAAIVRAATAAVRGHATLIRASAATRAAVPVFEPEAPALAALSRRLKETFDPAGILNPGRMHADI